MGDPAAELRAGLGDAERGRCGRRRLSAAWRRGRGGLGRRDRVRVVSDGCRPRRAPRAVEVDVAPGHLS